MKKRAVIRVLSSFRDRSGLGREVQNTKQKNWLFNHFIHLFLKQIISFISEINRLFSQIQVTNAINLYDYS